MFTRVAGAPADRNLIDFYFDAGVNFNGVLAAPSRRFVRGRVCLRSYLQPRQRVGRRQQRFTGVAAPIRDYEAVIEASYQAQIAPGWNVQPDFQYVFHPGGHVANPFSPSGVEAIPDAIVVGVRTTIKF